MGNGKDHIDSPSQEEVRDVAFRVFYKTILGGHLRQRAVRQAIQMERYAFRDLSCSSDNISPNRCPTTQAFVIQICRSRRLFLTTDGQLGIGPKCVQPGDTVFCLSSAAVPLLLRSRSHAQHRWALLGEVYVNGMASASDDYGPQLTPHTRQFIESDSLKTLPSQQLHLNSTSGIFEPKDGLNRNADRAKTRGGGVNDSPYKNAQHPYNYRKRRDGTHSRAQRSNTFMFLPQCFESSLPPPRIGNEGASRAFDLAVSSESQL